MNVCERECVCWVVVIFVVILFKFIIVLLLCYRYALPQTEQRLMIWLVLTQSVRSLTLQNALLYEHRRQEIDQIQSVNEIDALVLRGFNLDDRSFVKVLLRTVFVFLPSYTMTQVIFVVVSCPCPAVA